jgi:hypothetical protein
MNPSGEELTDQSFRLDQEIDDALTAYCKRSGANKNKAIAEAVAQYEVWYNAGGPQKEKNTHFVFLRNSRTFGNGRTPAVSRATKLSAQTMWSLGEVRGKRSIGRTINEALRHFFQEQSKDRLRAYDKAAMSRFMAPLPVDLDTVSVGNWFRELPLSQVLIQDGSVVPDSVKGAPVLIDSTYLLGLMIREIDALTMDEYGNVRKGTLLERAFMGDLVMTTTTAQIAEFAEKAAGFFAARSDQELREYFESHLSHEISVATSNHLASRLKELPASGIAIIPTEQEDYVQACQLRRGGWPVSLPKLAGIAALTRITGSKVVHCLSVFHTKNIASMHVWEHFFDGYCKEASSNDRRHTSYLNEWYKDYGAPSAEDDDSPVLRKKANPYFKNLLGLRG